MTWLWAPVTWLSVHTRGDPVSQHARTSSLILNACNWAPVTTILGAFAHRDPDSLREAAPRETDSNPWFLAHVHRVSDSWPALWDSDFQRMPAGTFFLHGACVVPHSRCKHEATLRAGDSDSWGVCLPLTHSSHMSQCWSSSVTFRWHNVPTAHGSGPCNLTFGPTSDS